MGLSGDIEAFDLDKTTQQLMAYVQAQREGERERERQRGSKRGRLGAKERERE